MRLKILQGQECVRFEIVSSVMMHVIANTTKLKIDQIRNTFHLTTETARCQQDKVYPTIYSQLQSILPVFVSLIRQNEVKILTSDLKTGM